MNKENQEEKFGLFTTVSMISGIVIGSGIFFKVDDVLFATGGSVALGVLLWVVSAFGIIFGGLTVSLYARKETKAGGLITYSEMAWGDMWGFIAGWFQTVFYFPAIVAILSFVAAIYLGLVFDITNPTDPRIWIFTLVIMVSTYLFNIFSTRSAGKFQSISLVIKLAAVLGLAFLGFIFGSKSNLVSVTTNISSNGLFHGLIACAFSFDGWFVAPSIAHEIKNPKKNLSMALVLAPLMILCVYLLYFLGINAMLGPAVVMELGDASVGYIVSDLFGPIGVNIVYALVFMSILGAVNGLVLGYIRLPYALALREDDKRFDKLTKIHSKYEVSILSSVIAFIFTLIWILLHALSVFKIKTGFFDFSHLQIDSLPIVLMYIFYISLFVKVIVDFIKTGEHGRIYGLIFPILAIWGSSLIVIGGFSNPNGAIYLLISVVGISMGIVFKKLLYRY